MPDTFVVPFVKLIVLCQRATRYRREQVADPDVSQGDLRRVIWYDAPFRELRIEAT